MTARLLPGQIIPGTRYKVLAKVGQGAMGVVYAAEHVDLEKRVALKLLASRIAQRPDAVERLRHEARTASRIGSPYICDVTDFGQLPDGRVFLVMEYLQGRSLRAVLDAEGHVSPARAIPMLRQVAKALGAAHEKGIIHLDVKPDNVMLLDRGRREAVKVVDFGVAGLLADGAQPLTENAVNGTPAYMAPERALGRGYDHRSDIYSLGVLSYETLTGSLPFDSDDVVSTLRKHVHERPEPLRERAPDRRVPADVEELIIKLLTKDPAKRPQSMAEVEGLLCEAQIASGLTTAWDDLELPHVDDQWRAKLAARMPSPWSRRTKTLLGAALSAAVLALVAAVYFGFVHQRIVLVPVEVTRTEEPPPVAEQLFLAARAATAHRYVEPADNSALFHIERAEAEAERLGVESKGARALRELYASALGLIGNHLLNAGLRDLAIAKFKEALLFDASDRDLQRKAELTPGERREYADRARRNPSERAAPRPSTEDQAKGLAASLFVAAREGRISEARSSLKALAQVDRGGTHAARVADALRGVARSSWKEGRPEEARSIYGLVAELDPSDAEAKDRARASAALPLPAPPADAKKRPELAESGADIPRNPTISRAAADAGTAALAKGWLDEAETAFRRAVRSDPVNATAVAGMAEVAFERARYPEALDYARKAARLSPRSARYHTIVGDAYFKLLRFNEARAAYDRALMLDPQNGLVRTRLERVRISMGER